MAMTCNQALVAIAKPEDAPHAIAGPQFEHDAAHHVVQTRRESAAGHDAARQSARIKKNPVARSGQLERSQRVWVALAIAQ